VTRSTSGRPHIAPRIARRLRWSIALAASLAGATALVLADCDNVQPLAYTPPTFDAEVPDHIDINKVQACRECLLEDGGKCYKQYVSCVMKDPRCPRYSACLTDSFCWGQFDITNFGNLPPCAVACFQDAGVSGLNEILGAAASGYFCLSAPTGCGSVCLDQTDGGGTAVANDAAGPDAADGGAADAP
jgi:hypothetical protein